MVNIPSSRRLLAGLVAVQLAGAITLEEMDIPAHPPIDKIPSHMAKRQAALEKRAALSCDLSPAATSKFDSCVSSVGAWVERNDCETLTDTVSMVSCNCHFFTEIYDCADAWCSNFAVATVTDESFATIQELAPTCTEAAASGLFDDSNEPVITSSKASFPKQTSSEEEQDPLPTPDIVTSEKLGVQEPLTPTTAPTATPTTTTRSGAAAGSALVRQSVAVVFGMVAVAFVL